MRSAGTRDEFANFFDLPFFDLVTRAFVDIESVRTITVAAPSMPPSMVRLSGRRESLSDSVQALSSLAGADSILIGNRLLATGNVGDGREAALLARLDLTAVQEKPPRSSRDRIFEGASA